MTARALAALLEDLGCVENFLQIRQVEALFGLFSTKDNQPLQKTRSQGKCGGTGQAGCDQELFVKIGNHP